MLKLQHALLASLCLLPLAATEAMATTAGVTAAVNQNAKSTPPGGTVRTVVLGANVVQDETIETDGGGLVQILLADGTTFTVGPNSSITIDRFVYDPNANTAQVSATIGRGVFRFIGGRTSKTEGGVQLNTPVGTVGIRGGMADLNFTGAGQIDLLFGNEVTLDGPNGSDRIFQPGYSIVFGPNGQPTVVKTPPGSANFIQQALAGRPGQSGGSSQKPDDGKVAGSGVPGSNSGSNPPNPQEIPQPDLRAIELATPKGNDPHNAAAGLLPKEDTYGQAGFSSGLIVASTTSEGLIPLALNDARGRSRIKFDGNGNVEGAKTVLSTVGYANVGDENYDIVGVELAVTHGSYPDAPRLTASFNGQEQYTTDDVAVTPPDPSEAYFDCTCDFVSWGTWGADFAGTSGNEPIRPEIKGHWVTGDIVDPSEYDSLIAAYQTGDIWYSGTAFGSIQSIDIEGVTSPVYDASGDVHISWSFSNRQGQFDLSDFTGGGLSFSASSGIFGGDLPKGFFAGSSISTESLLSVSGAFVNHGSDLGAAAIGSFSGYGIDDGVVVGASGIFAAGDLTPVNND